jgi:hypothetical protein
MFSRWPFIGSNHIFIFKTLTITFTNCQVYEYLGENTSILKWNSIPIIRSCINSAKNQAYYHSNRQTTAVFVFVLLCFVQCCFFCRVCVAHIFIFLCCCFFALFVFALCLVPEVSRVSGLSILHYPFVFLWRLHNQNGPKSRTTHDQRTPHL